MTSTQQKYKDFGPKNIGLIALVAVALGGLAWSQRPIRTAAIRNGTSLGTGLAISSTGGQVLGATSYNKELISQFEPIDIKTSTDNSSAAFSAYITQITVVSNADGLDNLLNGDARQRSKDKQDKFIADLKRIAVPSALADYHKLLLADYELRFEQQTSLQSADYDTYISAVSAQLDQLRQNFSTSAGITLP